MLPEIKGIQLLTLPWGETTFDEVLDQYEAACITLQRSPEGQLYMTWWNDADDVIERWVCLRMTKQRLRAVLSGEMVSREAIENPEDGYLLAVDIDLATDKPARIIKTTAAALPQDSLPHPEATLNIPMPATV